MRIPKRGFVLLAGFLWLVGILCCFFLTEAQLSKHLDLLNLRGVEFHWQVLWTDPNGLVICFVERPVLAVVIWAAFTFPLAAGLAYWAIRRDARRALP